MKNNFILFSQKWRILFTKTKKYYGINVQLSILFLHKKAKNSHLLMLLEYLYEITAIALHR